VVDKWGIPVLRFHFKRSDHEWKLARHMERTFTDVIVAMGGRALPLSPTARESSGMTIPGTLKHEVGTTRMGTSARNSVLNSFCQAHEMTNLFVCDGGPLVSSPDKNPTHTINALAWRASDYMAEEMRKGVI
jgi:choline dehydrogenase-like flavoprotein